MSEVFYLWICLIGTYFSHTLAESETKGWLCGWWGAITAMVVLAILQSGME